MKLRVLLVVAILAVAFWWLHRGPPGPSVNHHYYHGNLRYFMA